MRAVRDVMTKTVVVVDKAAPFKRIVELLHEYRVSALPVIDEERHVVGIVTEADLLAKEGFGRDGGPKIFEGRERRAARAKAAGTVASHVMSSPVTVIAPEAGVAEAARLMHERGVKRLPVVDAAGGLVGIVSRCDLLRVFLRDDADILAEVRDEVLGRVLVVEPGTVRADVRDGVVTLEGQVERRSMLPVVAGLVRGVDGVVAVESRLTYAIDDTGPTAAQRVGWVATGHGLGVRP